MKKEIYLEEFNMPIIIQSYRKSKSIKVFCKDKYIKVTKPIWYSNRDIIRYLKQNRENIVKSFEKNLEVLNTKKNANLTHILYLGNIYEINVKHNEHSNNIYFEDNNLIINIKNNDLSNDNLKQIIRKFLKNKSKEIIYNQLNYVSNLTNIRYTTYKIKDCKTMWGSCSSKGNLNFNYKLVMFPKNIMNQIILHELCHLKFLNHSNNFWNLVYSYCKKEDYSLGEKWIKLNQELLNSI